MTHPPADIAKRLEALHEHTAAHETAMEQATREAKEQLLAKLAEQETQTTGDGTAAVD